jgi:hypothetical protein
MRSHDIAQIIDVTLRYSAAIAVAVVAGIAALFGIILLFNPEVQDRGEVVILLSAWGVGVGLFILIAMQTDVVAGWLPGERRFWSIALRVVVYSVAVLGLAWLVWQYAGVGV